MKKHVIEKRKKYFGSKSIVLGSYSYLDKKVDLYNNFYVKDFNDKTIFIIPGISKCYEKSLKFATYVFSCFESIMCDGFEAYSGYENKKSEDVKISSSFFNKGIYLDDICFITGCE